MFLDDDTFERVVRHAPLISMDLVVTNPVGQILLGKRLNRPAQGYWFVPGGRILKGERFEQAFARLCAEELGHQCKLAEASFLAPFEHHYPDSVFGEGCSTHYVVMAYHLQLDIDLGDLPCMQHGGYAWFDVGIAEKDDSVHRHTRWYLPYLSQASPF